MSRTPLQQIGDTVGMYAYLAAVGGLRYWPGLRRASIEETARSAQTTAAPQAEESFSDSVRHEYSSSRERMPVG